MEFISKSEEQTEKLARWFASSLKKGDVVALYGDLGAGKTAFTRGILEYFNYNDCHSPTFNLVNEYLADITVYHFDAYRINENDWHNAGFDDYLFGDGICVIEWPINIEKILPKDTIKIYIDYNGKNRIIKLD